MKRLGSVHNTLAMEAEALLIASLDGRVESLFVEDLVKNGYTPEDAQQFVLDHQTAIRDENVIAVDEMDEQIEASATLAEKVLAHCDGGALTMRATRNGQQVVATVCMSHAMNLFPAMGSEEPVEIRRKMID